MWWSHEGMGWWMLFGGVWMVAFWVIVIGLVSWAIQRAIAGWKEARPSEETPLEIAKKRLARGEITVEEFDRLKQTLQ